MQVHDLAWSPSGHGLYVRYSATPVRHRSMIYISCQINYHITPTAHAPHAGCDIALSECELLCGDFSLTRYQVFPEHSI